MELNVPTPDELQTRVVIVDPGMMSASGHHAGFASFLAGSPPTDSLIEVTCSCHHELDTDIKALLIAAGYKVSLDFHSNFYEIFEQSKLIGDAQAFLVGLAREYAGVLRRTRSQSPLGRLIYFYPSMAWEHAYALGLALRLLDTDDSAEHVVCAMFSPHQAKPIYRLAFDNLSRRKNVGIYASDWELAEAYGSLLDSAPLPIHPCFLADWSKLDRNKIENPKTADRIILYMGDAKVDKGFCDVPAIAEQLLSDEETTIELYIQYTYLWENKEIGEAESQLQKLAERDDRLILEHRYLPNEELHQVLREASVFVFTYKKDAYEHKSSGFLWLVCWYKCEIICLNNSWISREANRLGKTCNVYPKLALGKYLKVNKCMLEPQLDMQGSYSSQLFRSFFPWLIGQLKIESGT